MSQSNDKTRDARYALQLALEKLRLYRVNHNGEYIGGMEYATLVEMIEKSIADLGVPSAVMELPEGPVKWETPADTVGKLISCLRTLDPSLPFHTAYFVEIDGKRVVKTTTASMSYETVSEGRVQKFDRENLSVVVWATQDEREATASSATTVRVTDDMVDAFLLTYLASPDRKKVRTDDDLEALVKKALEAALGNVNGSAS